MLVLATLYLVILALCAALFFVFTKFAKVRSAHMAMCKDAAPIQEAEKSLKEAESRYLKLQDEYHSELQTLRENEKKLSLYELSVGTMDMSLSKTGFSAKSLEELELALVKVRDDIKKMVKAKTACVCSMGNDVAVNGSKAAARKLFNREIKLRLRCLDNEFKMANAVVDWNNVERLKERCERTFTEINNNGDLIKKQIRRQYLDLKLLELDLNHHINMRHQQIKEEEREERRLLLEKKREEERIERAARKAVRDREVMEALVAQELAKLDPADTEKALLIERMRNKLEGLKKAEVRALSMAELTRAGYIYVISNETSFGNGICKVGMTRRVDPNDRVKELGDASVPEFFDVHAFVYSDDAPSLERHLHENLEEQRVNLINRRKEFFRVNPDDVIGLIKKYDPSLQIEHAQIG